MAGLIDRQIGELSGGQQQRVSIARALVQESNLLRMDERFGGVDAPSREAILRLLDCLRAENISVLVSAHNLNLNVSSLDKMALLNRQLVAYGAPCDVITSETLAPVYAGQAVWRGDKDALVPSDMDCCGKGGYAHE